MYKTIETRVEEILNAYGLNFNIIKAPLAAKISNEGEENEKWVPSPYFGLYNDKTHEVINTVKEGYTISQNKDIVRVALAGMEKFGDAIAVQKAGSLNGGRKVYIQLRIEGDGKVGDDTVERFVTLIDSNDGSTGLSVGIGDLTMSCMNQFFKFYKAGEAKFRHTATIEQKIETMPELISTALGQSLKQIELYQEFEGTSISQHLAHKLVKELLGYDRVITSPKDYAELPTKSIAHMDNLYAHIEKETNSKGMNLWGLHSGVTSWTSHPAERSAKAKPKRENWSEENLIVGKGYAHNLNSLEFAINAYGELTKKTSHKKELVYA